MGLSGRKEKQRISHDPRNLSWADDASKFGSAYLTKLGWDKACNTLGSNINVHQKLDMLGIGANRKGGKGEEVAWKQGREFDEVLRKLNAAVAGAGGDEGDIEVESKSKIAGFAAASTSTSTSTSNTPPIPEDTSQAPTPVDSGVSTPVPRKKARRYAIKLTT